MHQFEELDTEVVILGVLNSLLDPDFIRKNYSAIFDKSSDVYSDSQYWATMANLHKYLADLCKYKQMILEGAEKWN